MRKSYYINNIKGNRDYEEVYELVNEAQDDKQITDEDWEEIYELAKSVLC